MIAGLLRESGERWMEPDEQFRAYPALRDFTMPRPVWLFLSMVADHKQLPRRNGAGIAAHMSYLREAFA